MSDLRARAKESQGILRGVQERRSDGSQAEEPALPDVRNSDITADLTAPIGVAWAHVMADVLWVGKGTSPGLNYEFRGIDAVLNTVGPVLRKHGVSVVPVRVEPTYSQVMTGNNRAMNYCRVTVDYAVLGPTGDVLEVTLQSAGEAFDTGDKATPKAMSVALRTLYLNALAIPTNRPADDPEYTTHELAAPPPPTADGYYEEITRPDISLIRLQQIRREFNDHPDIAETEIEHEFGKTITLAELLTQVGRAKQSAADRARQKKADQA
jgi:hypothetical protein